MNGWQLGIDFGTSYTVAAVAEGDENWVVDLESDGKTRIPSAVFFTESGDILVGTAAQHQAVFAPERYEPTPKRSLGEGQLFLGDRPVAVTDLVAAVFRRVYTEACRQKGERTPREIRLTYPAEWGDTRLAMVREAAQKAGLANFSFVPEPVAAAARIALARTQPGHHIAVYDFGGGTFDAAVLLRTDEGFEVAGPPQGRDPLGGEDIDEAVIGYVGEVLAKERPEDWALLRDPQNVTWRRHAAAFRAEVQGAKETLSEVNVCELWVPGIERGVQLTRAELNKLVAPSVGATVDALRNAIDQAQLTPRALDGIYLVGGSSRIPLVADSIWRRLQIRPVVQDNPKSVVALGAAGWITSPTVVRTRPAAPVHAPAPATETQPTAVVQPPPPPPPADPAVARTEEAPTTPSPTRAPPPPAPPPPKRARRRKPLLIGGGVGALALAGAIAAILISGGGHSSPTIPFIPSTPSNPTTSQPNPPPNPPSNGVNEASAGSTPSALFPQTLANSAFSLASGSPSDQGALSGSGNSTTYAGNSATDEQDATYQDSSGNQIQVTTYFGPGTSPMSEYQVDISSECPTQQGTSPTPITANGSTDGQLTTLDCTNTPGNNPPFSTGNYELWFYESSTNVAGVIVVSPSVLNSDNLTTTGIIDSFISQSG
ncbi:MAG TPA: Hsp70 family protein [Solirubrobacteraceae bacterium]|nr:Hsp70 family protein [Solirubrobacteraceae bacterium]